jgi:hypothetical protein
MHVHVHVCVCVCVCLGVARGTHSSSDGFCRRDRLPACHFGLHWWLVSRWFLVAWWLHLCVFCDILSPKALYGCVVLLLQTHDVFSW